MMRTLLILLVLAPLCAAGGPPIRSARINKAVEGVQPAVVKIYGAKGFRGVFGYMTGVIVHKSGLVITRGSVTLDEAHHIDCHLHDGRRFEAQIRRDDRRSRMTLLKLIAPAGTEFSVAPLGTSKNVRPGDFVLLIGNAYKVAIGKEPCAVNLGVVSAFTRMKMRSGLSDFPYDGRVILHDAMNNPGVYGGPLVNIQGKVIGLSGTITESRATNVQIHYAIPIDDLKAFIEDTLKNPDASRLYSPRRPNARAKKPEGFHGIRVLRGGFNRATEAYVDRVVPGSPADKAGIRADDLIIKVDEMPVKSWKTFTKIMKKYRAGETTRLTLKRKDQIKLISITLIEKKSS